MTQQSFVAGYYGPRASDYVASKVHSGGADLDQIEAFVRGLGSAAVLDIGCGGGHVAYRVAPLVSSVTACDVTTEMLEQVAAEAQARGLSNVSVRQAAAESLPFADESFDVVLSRFTTHHWMDWEAGLREAKRVLKQNGKALFADVVAPSHPLLDTHLQSVELLRDPSHVRNHTVEEWVAALARAGFRAVSLTPRRLRMEFDVWTERTRSPDVAKDAIRWLQTNASAAVRNYFAIDSDGSFDLDTLVVETEAISPGERS